MSDKYQSRSPYMLSATFGMFGAQLLSSAVIAHEPTTHFVMVDNHATSKTQQLSYFAEGLLQEGVATLLSHSAKAAVGDAGLKRIENFLRLQAGWDGRASKPIDLRSVAVFSQFFAKTGMRPAQLAVFMSAQGNLVVNWLDSKEQLVEIEFQPSAVDYFIEGTEQEGTVRADQIGFDEIVERTWERIDA